MELLVGRSCGRAAGLGLSVLRLCLSLLGFRRAFVLANSIWKGTKNCQKSSAVRAAVARRVVQPIAACSCIYITFTWE